MKTIDIPTASLEELNAFYNANSGSKIKQTYNTIEKAREKVTELVEAMAGLESGSSKKKSGAKKAAKPVKGAKKEKKAPATEGSGSRGRASNFAGQTITIAIDPDTKKPFANPRREGTHGFKSFALVPAGAKGISYEDYIKAGGRPNDLRWDVDRGTLIVK